MSVNILIELVGIQNSYKRFKRHKILESTKINAEIIIYSHIEY